MTKKLIDLIDENTHEEVKKWLAKYPPEQKRSAVLPILLLIQKKTNGWLKEEMLEAILPFVPRKDIEEIKETKQTKAEKEEALEIPTEKMALYSERNLHWNGVGALEKGYNIVTKEASVKWLAHKAVREASPKEVARHYGKI